MVLTGGAEVGTAAEAVSACLGWAEVYRTRKSSLHVTVVPPPQLTALAVPQQMADCKFVGGGSNRSLGRRGPQSAVAGGTQVQAVAAPPS